MAEINSSNQSLTNILDKLGINSAKEKGAPKEIKDQLGQSDFLKLMTTQLQIKILSLLLTMPTLLLKWLNFLQLQVLHQWMRL